MDSVSMELDNFESVNLQTTINDVTIHQDSKSEERDSFQQTEHHREGNVECESNSSVEASFKKPVPIIGPRRGKNFSTRSIEDVKSVKLSTASSSSAGNTNITDSPTTDSVSEKTGPISDLKQQLHLPYREPSWAGIPNQKYKIEVLKSGVILDSIDLNDKSFYVIGRLPVCDIPLAHPTISRYHAILQYRCVNDDKNGPGYYIYDLESTHGTFWNGSRIKPKHYVKLHGGHMIRFGCSQRKFIFHTPSEEVEAESEYSVTELKEIRRLELIKRKREEEEEQQQREDLTRTTKEKEEAEGIDWGMGEDADEETDMIENPYAATTNEESFFDDPKKTLRGWFEREGYDMQYQTEEKGIGQFLCWIELPIDNMTGRSIRAEALVKGKKKESVIQCALEACRILDRQGLLRQATHEGKKRKSRNWEEEDYYDSDEDNFLDRTGTVERKREQRMRNAGKLETKAETHASLVEKHSVVTMQITKIQNTLKNHEKISNTKNDNSDEDTLDAFMSNLSSTILNKAEIIKLKLRMQHLQKEEARLKTLINIAKPASLPELNSSQSAKVTVKSNEKTITIIDDNQQVEGENSVKRLVPKKGQYGLITKNKVIAVETGEVNGSSNVHEEKLNENNEITESDNDKDGIESQEIDCNKNVDDIAASKRKKRNMRRTQRRAEKVVKEAEKTYDENVYREDYSMWIPPENQSGDGKTSLNDKLGY